MRLYRPISVFAAVILVLSSLVGLLPVRSVPPAIAQSYAGVQEFFVPLWLDDTRLIFMDIDSDPDISAEDWHSWIGVAASRDETWLYYDHWENGLGKWAECDEVFQLDEGEYLVLESGNIPVPRSVGSPPYPYDGGDRIFVAGYLMQCVVCVWPENVGTQTGTVFTDAWEAYPVVAWDANYTIPIGEDLVDDPAVDAHRELEGVYVQVMASANNT
ncbi:MAG TPA: hypothetical protein G4O13_08130, partial [Dehalococcoidia bacterium]|nr:hypothetical protein [Dehalococcoidia bacterium]